MFGTTKIGTRTDNELDIPRPTIAYLIRYIPAHYNISYLNDIPLESSFFMLYFVHYDLRAESWNLPMRLWEWTDLNDSGQFLGVELGSAMKIYKKELEPGVHQIDDTSAFYLFEYKGYYEY